MNSKTEAHLKKSVSPRGSRLSDKKIKESVCDALGQAPNVNCSDIKVSVERGVVALSGTVEKQPMKQQAEDWIKHVAGVTEVQNELRTPLKQQASGRKR